MNQAFEPTAADAVPTMSPDVAFDVQDDLLMACNDLDRLRGLLAGTCRDLAAGFSAAMAMLEGRRAAGGLDAAFLDELHGRLAHAVTALQFEDMAGQLLDHTCRTLRSSADRLAAASFGADDAEAVVEPRPTRPNPVTQDEMDAGSIELF